MFPDFNGWLETQWGSGDEGACFLAQFSGASNIVIGTNPPYCVGDFVSFYPKFAGGAKPTPIPGAVLTMGSAAVTATTAGLTAGQVLWGPGVPSSATVLSVDSDSQLTMSAAATVSGTVTITALDISQFIVPVPVLNAYIVLASASLFQARWCEMWQVAMGLYVAHYATLWLRSDGDIYNTPGQAAHAGLARGILISASAGPASKSIQPVTGQEEWGSFTQTSYGNDFVQLARSAGAGMCLLW
jgi:hypothetical protein